MIDIENELYTKIATALRSQFPNISMFGEDARVPSSFPCVSFVEADNYSHEPSEDSSGNENYVNVMYEVNVYSNNLNGKKTECKTILAIIDNIMMGLGFARTMKNPVTMDDATIHRIMARYIATVSASNSASNKIYRR